MRTALVVGAVAMAALGATSASAQWRDNYRSAGWQYERAIQETRAQCDEELRWAGSRREYNRIARWCNERLAELEREYHREARWGQRDRWGFDDPWRSRDRDDDDDDDDDYDDDDD